MSNRSIREKERDSAIKKNEKLKHRRRKARFITVLFCFLVVCAAVFCLLSLTVLFKIENIEVKGNSLYTAEEITQIAGIEAGDNMFLISEDIMSRSVEKKLPFITSLKIKRVLPDKITLTVTETSETIVISNSQGYYSADTSGKVLKKYVDMPRVLVLLTVSNKAEHRVGEIAEFDEQEKEIIERYFKIVEGNTFYVNFINVEDPYDTYMKIDDRFIVKMGARTDFEMKLSHLKVTLEKINSTETGIIDLSSWSQKKQEAYFTEQPIDDYIK